MDHITNETSLITSCHVIPVGTGIDRFLVVGHRFQLLNIDLRYNFSSHLSDFENNLSFKIQTARVENTKMKEAKKREEKQKELKEKEKRRKEQKEKERFKIKSHTDSFPHSFYDRFWESPCMVQLQILNHSYRKDFIIDQQGEGEGVLDDLMDALKTGQAYNRDNRRQKPRQTRELFI